MYVFVKSIPRIVVAISVALSVPAVAQPMISLSNLGQKASAIELSKVVDWKPGDTKPCPLTRDKAVEIAKAEVAKQGMGPFPDEEIKVRMDKGFINDEGQRKLVPDNACLWYYTIRMGSVLPKVATVRISMSGSIMEGGGM